MARQLSVNYTDTPVTGGTTPSITVPSLNYVSDFRVTADDPGECRITNLTSPIDQPERFRFAFNDVADVYRNAGIDPTLFYQSRRGTQILCQLTDVYKVTDTVDASYLAMLPVTAHMVLRVPNNDLINADIAMGLIGRMLAGLFDPTADAAGTRLKSMLRGALVPSRL